MSILDEPMFPLSGYVIDVGTDDDGKPIIGHAKAVPGKSARVYAAIHLCVPESGNAELDAMIRRAQRVRLAGMALTGMSKHDDNVYSQARAITLAISAYQYADALLAQLEKP